MITDSGEAVAIEYTQDDLEEAILNYMKSESSIREFGSKQASMEFFLIRYNPRIREIANKLCDD